MPTALLIASLLMGLAGGPHCAAMCGAVCAGVVRAGNAPPARAMLSFQLGRLAGYAAAGAAAGAAVQSFAWLSSQTAALRPLWVLLHLAVLLWGLSLLVLAREPAWVGAAGRAVWQRLRPFAAARHGALAAGALWVFMPCGLLYSALLVASLAGGAAAGALAMALFALGSGAALWLFPPLLARMRKDWGARAGGALLLAAAGWALWSDLAHRVAQWCGLA